MTERLDFNDIIKRVPGTGGKDKQPPTDMFQCVVFFSRPIIDEIEELKQLSLLNANKKFMFFGGNLQKLIRNLTPGLEKQRFIFPFYSENIFMSQQEAEKFFPQFISQLIKEGKLPLEVINEDKSVNEDMIQAAVAPVKITILEQEKSEFREFNNIVDGL